MSNLLKLKADKIDAIYGLIDIAKSKNVKEVCTTTNNTTTKIKNLKPIKRKRNYIPKMKCVVDGCTKLSRGNGVGEKGAYCIGLEGEDILGNAHTMDAIIIYLGANFVPNTTGRKN